MLLKTIWVMELLPLKKTHELDKLYDALPQSWKDRISQQYAAEMADPFHDSARNSPGRPATLEESLAMASKSFQQWRYMFEGTPEGQFLSPVVVAVTKSILAVKPDWEALCTDLDKPPQPQVPLVKVPIDELRWTLQVGSPQQVRHPLLDEDREERQSE